MARWRLSKFGPVKRWMAILLVTGGVLRIGWVAFRYAEGERSGVLQYPDEDAYRLSAASLAAGQGLIDEFGYRATYMPGYPAFLALFMGLPRPLLWARLAQAALGAFVGPATFLLALRWQELRGAGQPVGRALPAKHIPQSATRMVGGAHPTRLRGAGRPVGWALPTKHIPQSATQMVGGAHPTRLRGAGQLVGWALPATLAGYRANRRSSDGAAGRVGRTEGRSGEAAAVRVAAIAGLAAAIDPFLIFFSGLLLTEALFAVALVMAWAWLLPMMKQEGKPVLRPAMLTGLMLWVCIMLRPSAVILAFLAAGAVAVYRRLDGSGIRAAAVIVATVIVLLGPWAARNRWVLGEWRWLTTRGGISLYDGLREGAGGGSDLAHTKTLADMAGLSETQWDAYFRAAAWAAARRDPLRVVRLAGRKFLRTWSPAPNVEGYRQGAVAVLSVAWTSVVLGAAAVGVWTHRTPVWTWATLLLPVVGFTLLHMIFVGSVRYRVPVMPLVMVLSAAGVVRAGEVLRRRADRAGEQNERTGAPP